MKHNNKNTNKNKGVGFSGLHPFFMVIVGGVGVMVSRVAKTNFYDCIFYIVGSWFSSIPTEFLKVRY